jgi:hypothetical protein
VPVVLASVGDAGGAVAFSTVQTSARGGAWQGAAGGRLEALKQRSEYWQYVVKGHREACRRGRTHTQARRLEGSKWRVARLVRQRAGGRPRTCEAAAQCGGTCSLECDARWGSAPAWLPSASAAGSRRSQTWLGRAGGAVRFSASARGSLPAARVQA